MDTHGRHLLVEYSGCEPDILNDVGRIQDLMNRAARAAQTNIVASMFQPFEPTGVSGVVVVEESHLSIHTWPEHHYAAVDFFTCGDGLPEKAHEVLKAGLQAQQYEMLFVTRGDLAAGLSMKIQGHTLDSVPPLEGEATSVDEGAGQDARPSA